MESVDIIFRSCDRSAQKRYIDVPKQELLLGCLNSVLVSAKQAAQEFPRYQIKVHVLDDHSSEETVARMVGLFNTAMLGLRAGSGLSVGLLGAVIGVHRSLTLSAMVVVLIAVWLYTRERRFRDGPA